MILGTLRLIGGDDFGHLSDCRFSKVWVDFNSLTRWSLQELSAFDIFKNHPCSHIPEWLMYVAYWKIVCSLLIPHLAGFTDTLHSKTKLQKKFLHYQQTKQPFHTSDLSLICHHSQRATAALCLNAHTYCTTVCSSLIWQVALMTVIGWLAVLSI